MESKQFADGFHFDLPSETAPEWVKGKISVRVKDAVAFLEKNVNSRGFVTIDVKQSKKGSIYCELNSWKPGGEVQAEDAKEDESEAIPF